MIIGVMANPKVNDNDSAVSQGTAHCPAKILRYEKEMNGRDNVGLLGSTMRLSFMNEKMRVT